MGKKFTITIEVEGGTHKVKITDDAGNEKECNSLLLTAGRKDAMEFYTFAWGHPKDAAWSLGEGLARSQGNEWWDSFIYCHLKDMASRVLSVEQTTPDELLSRWAKEDKVKDEEKKKAKEGAH